MLTDWWCCKGVILVSPLQQNASVDRWQRFVESDGFYYKEQNCVRAELQHPELDCPFRQLISHQPDSSEENNSSSTIFQGDF
ncbi:hypothetical protein Y032_0490g2384 [Ancylostoma ceylanicum]|uniref:Uncharacterized protein n=1 Tax=Ancylostoma ceylanicum TaxID=53326 RepID=A0A016WVG1_9BILA|nr:hypothetical protein Y032_0490g2384 [Ancylostoma ceylanicum]